MEAFIPIAGFLLVVLIWFIGTYNGLIRLRNHCGEAWAGIDTELKRRHDLIPNLVETVKGYAAHERQVLELLTASRARAAGAGSHVRDLCAAENDLVRGVTHVFALAENYPALKADRHFLQLQHELVDTEDRIQAARRFYNANIRDLNNRVQMFPSSVVARMASIEAGEFFEVESLAVRQAPQMRL